MFELVIILLSISKIFCCCCDCCNCCLKVEVNRPNNNRSDNGKSDIKFSRRRIDFSKLPSHYSNNEYFRIEILPKMNDINISIFNTLAKKKLYFSDEDRKAPGFKKFEFLKNCFPNGDNRCWLISEIMLFGNSPFQEILLNNDVSDNIYLETLKKLFIKMREENDKKGYLNCDELVKLIDFSISRNGRFSPPFYGLEQTFQTCRRERYSELIFVNIFDSDIPCTTGLFNKVYTKKLRDLCPILYSVQISSGYCIDIAEARMQEKSRKNKGCELKYCLIGDVCLNRPYQHSTKGDIYPTVMYLYEDEQTEKNFLDILFRRYKIRENEVNGKIFETEEELYGFYESMLNDIKGNFEFFCNGIILTAAEYHYFAICHNKQDDNWYNFNSLDGKNGDICNDLISNLVRDKEIKIGSHVYIPDLFLITVKKKN